MELLWSNWIPEITYIQSKVALRCGRDASITSRVGHQYVTANCSLTFTLGFFTWWLVSLSQNWPVHFSVAFFQVLSYKKTLFLVRKSACNEATELAVIIAFHCQLTEHPTTGTLAAYASDEPIKKLCNKFLLICDKIMTGTLYSTSCPM